ncbi:MAG: hypothetical protein U0798_06195 [Gemmataceae bacterium]
MPTITCSSCGGKVSIPEGHSRAKIRCGGCGYYADVPPEYRADPSEENDPGSKAKKPDTALPMAPYAPESQPSKKVGRVHENDEDDDEEEDDRPKAKPAKSRKAKPRTNPLDNRPDFEPDEPAGENLLDGDDIERDGLEATPSTVPGTGLKKCPECRGELPLDATLCVHCGTDLATKKKKPKREFTPFFKEWEAYLKFDLRLKIFIALQAVNLVLAIFTAIIRGFDVLAFLAFMVVQGGLQAFLLGTFDKLTIKRNAKGRTEITKTWRFFFIPKAPEKIDWKVSHCTAIIATHNPGPVEWGVMIYLLCFGCVPGLLFYWFVIQPERFDIILGDVHGGTDQTIFRTTTRDLADEICTTINETTTLMYRKVH